VVGVSWSDAQSYADWLTRQSGKRYRLPSEAEWEFAAQAGMRSAYPWGFGMEPGRALCFDCGSQWDNKQTAPVGSFAANPWGLHDMHGNVWEWVNDWYGGKYYQSSSSDNPTGPTSGSDRVVRGVSWRDDPGNLRAALRGSQSPDGAGDDLGFRLVLPSSASGK